MAAAWQRSPLGQSYCSRVAVHVALGEVVLTVLLIVFTTVAFTGRKGPQPINGSNAEDVDIEVQHPDEDEPTTANPLNASEATPAAPAPVAERRARRSAPAEAAPAAAAARLPFLDNGFPDAPVVLHHCAAFRACGEGAGTLSLRAAARAFRLCVKTFVT